MCEARAYFVPNSITLAGSELAPNMFRASSEPASVMEFGWLARAVNHVQLSLTRVRRPTLFFTADTCASLTQAKQLKCVR